MALDELRENFPTARASYHILLFLGGRCAAWFSLLQVVPRLYECFDVSVFRSWLCKCSCICVGLCSLDKKPRMKFCFCELLAKSGRRWNRPSVLWARLCKCNCICVAFCSPPGAPKWRLLQRPRMKPFFLSTALQQWPSLESTNAKKGCHHWLCDARSLRRNTLFFFSCLWSSCA